MPFFASFTPSQLMCKQSPLQKGSQTLRNKVKNKPQKILKSPNKKIKK
jgi:hypothetical protein